METREALQKMRQLNDNERRKAKIGATEVVAGPVPEPSNYEHMIISKYPESIQLLIVALAVILLIAAFLTSAIRIYDVGHEVAYKSLPHEASAITIAVSMVLLAETGMIIFSLAFAVLPSGKISRFFLFCGAATATAIALVGNITAAHPPSLSDPLFAVSWLEATAPPLLVLGTAYVLKEQMLERIRLRSERTAKYNNAIAERDRTLRNPESASDWGLRYAEALKDAIYRANSRSAKAVRNTLSTENWIALVKRELDKDTQLQELYAGVTTATAKRNSRKPHSTTATANNRNTQLRPHYESKTATAKITAFERNNQWIAVCENCGREFERDTARAAEQSCRAHQKAHKRELVTSANGNGQK